MRRGGVCVSFGSLLRRPKTCIQVIEYKDQNVQDNGKRSSADKFSLHSVFTFDMYIKI